MSGIHSAWKLLTFASRFHEPARHLRDSRKIQALAKALAKALEDCHQASSWPGDRLPVSLESAKKVERLTRLIQLEKGT